MSNQVSRGPWQVGLAACAVFVSAAEYLTYALLRINSVSMGDIGLRMDEYQKTTTFAGMSANQIVEWQELAATVFGVVGVATLLMGILLWIGWMRPGVRITATITLLVSAAGSVAPLAGSIAGGFANTSALVGAFIQTLALVCVLLLWTPTATTWIKQEAQS